MLKALATNTALPTWTYNPDGEGRVLSVLAGSQNLVSSTTYNNFSAGWQPQVVTLGSGDSDTFTFDPNTGRMTEYKATISGSTAKGSLTWNANGSLQSLAIADQFNPTNNQTCTYTHDDLARIAQVSCGTGKWGQTFSYDAFGNIKKTGTSGQGTTFTPSYGPTTNQLTCLGCSYSYDSNGNLLGDGVSTYTWDAEGNLSQFNGGTALVYDALGRRVEQTNASGTNEILYGPDGSKLALMNGTTVTKAFVPLPGGATAVYSGSTLGWYRHPDWLGSSRIASTPSRTVSYDGAASYSPFGESPTETGDHSFTGQNQDLVPNFLYDFPAREYHPGEGRWLSPDPAGVAAADPSNPQSWNRYAYVGNSPLNLTDPMGMSDGDTTNVTKLWRGSDGCFYIQRGTSTEYLDRDNDTMGKTYNWGITELLGCPTGQTAQPPGTGGGNQGGGGGSASTLVNCVKRGSDYFSLQSGLQAISGGRLGNSWVSSAFLGSSVSSVITAGQWLSSKFSQSAGAPTAGQAAGTAAGEVLGDTAGPGLSALAPRVPNLTVTVAATASATLATPTGAAEASVSAAVSGTIPLSGAAALGAKALNVLGTVKLPWDLAVGTISGVICSL